MDASFDTTLCCKEIRVSPKWGYFRLELCPKLWNWKISPRHANRCSLGKGKVDEVEQFAVT